MEEEDVHNAKADAVKQQQTTKCKVAALGTNFTVQMLNLSSTAAAMGLYFLILFFSVLGGAEKIIKIMNISCCIFSEITKLDMTRR